MACVVHWRPWLGSWGSVAARAKAAAALHGRASPACDARPPKGCYSLRNFAQRKRGVGMVLTVRGIGRGSGAAVPAVRSRGGVQSELTSRDVIISDVNFSSLKMPRSLQSSICDDFVTKITSSQKMRHI